MKIVLVLCFAWFFASLSTFGQGILKTDFREITLNSDGSLGNEQNAGISFKNSGSNNLTFLKRGGIWVSAYDNQNRLYVAAHHLPGTDASDFWPGPMDTLLLKASNPALWDRTWYLSKIEVEEHRKKWSVPSYTIPSSIAEWPANGKQHTAPVLAPFGDTDGDGFYNPENGDFPFMSGDELTYAIANDEYDEHLVSKAAPLKLELHTKVYVFHDFPELTLMEYSLVNRTPIAFKDIRLSWVGDLSLGNPADNYFASDSAENAMLAFNADDLDEGPNGFGTMLPWIWVKSLTTPSSASVSLSGSGMSRFPQTDEEFRRIQEGFWADGSNLNAIDPSASSSRFLYNYPQWTDTSAPVPRFALLTVNQASIPAYSGRKWSFAVITGTSSEPGFPSALQEYKTKLANYTALLASASEVKPEANTVFDVTPSVWNGKMKLKVHTSVLISELQILDLQGRMVWKSGALQHDNNELLVDWQPGDQLRQGWYVLVGKGPSGSFRKKVLKLNYL